MALRTRFRGPMRVFEDAAEQRPRYDPVGPDDSSERIHQGYKKLQSGDFDIADGQTVTIPLGDLTSPCRAVEIRATGDIRIALNGGAALVCNRDVAADDVAEDVLFFARAQFTSIAITVAPGLVGTITGKWAILGDTV